MMWIARIFVWKLKSSNGRPLACALLLAVSEVSLQAHNEFVHQVLTESAFNSSESADRYLRMILGNNSGPFTVRPLLSGNPHPLEAGTTLTPAGWLMAGSYYEDETLYGGAEMRSIDHFYTVLPRPPQGLTDMSEVPAWARIIDLRPTSVYNSFRWATDETIGGPALTSAGRFDVRENDRKWQNARAHQLTSLISSNPTARKNALVNMLYALGHVIHLNQDLSSPDHVRNDNHFSEKHRFFENYGAKNFVKSSKQATWFALRPRGWSVWRAEGFSKLEDFWDRKKYNGQAKALNEDAANEFGKKLGLAEFCNGNFLGEDALYPEVVKGNAKQTFPFPSLVSSTSYKVAPNVITTFLKDGTPINRYSIKKVKDGIFVEKHSMVNYLGKKFPRRGPAVESVALTINDDAVLENYHDILYPKAIEYSAGIFDYFFRGQLSTTVTPNNDGSFQLTIQNLSGEAFKPGIFRLFVDDSVGNRSELNGANFFYDFPLNGTLANNSTLIATFRPPQAGLSYQYTLVYKGTIGTFGGNALDPVDNGIAIAVATFRAGGTACGNTPVSIDDVVWTDKEALFPFGGEIVQGMGSFALHIGDSSTAASKVAVICNPGPSYDVEITSVWTTDGYGNHLPPYPISLQFLIDDFLQSTAEASTDAAYGPFDDFVIRATIPANKSSALEIRVGALFTGDANFYGTLKIKRVTSP